jgi:carboxymethylenebutenolidase
MGSIEQCLQRGFLVLVIHEIFGVHEHIQDICRRFAKLGYMALAPELFVRQGNVLRLSDMEKFAH